MTLRVKSDKHGFPPLGNDREMRTNFVVFVASSNLLCRASEYPKEPETRGKASHALEKL